MKRIITCIVCVAMTFCGTFFNVFGTLDKRAEDVFYVADCGMEIYLADENAIIDISTQFPSEFDPSKATWPPEVTYDPLSNTLTRADVIVTSFEYVYDCGNGFSMYVLVECKF